MILINVTSMINRCLYNCRSMIFSFCVPGTGSVYLHRLDVPPSIRNGSLDSVVLDCQYSLNHSERDGMVLKWYLDGKTIYQWIPPARPQVQYLGTCLH